VETNTGFQISDEIYSRVVFRQLNLSAPPSPMTGKLDAVFCQEAMHSMVPQTQRWAIAESPSRGLPRSPTAC